MVLNSYTLQIEFCNFCFNNESINSANEQKLQSPYQKYIFAQLHNANLIYIHQKSIKKIDMRIESLDHRLFICRIKLISQNISTCFFLCHYHLCHYVRELNVC